MADQNLEQIMMTEYRRVTRGQSAGENAGSRLLGTVRQVTAGRPNPAGASAKPANPGQGSAPPANSKSANPEQASSPPANPKPANSAQASPTPANPTPVVAKQSAPASKPVSLPIPALPATKPSITTALGTSPQEVVAGLTRQLSSARQSVTTAGQVNKGYTEPAAQVEQPSVSSTGSVAGTIGQTALKVFSSGLGLMPLVSGLAGLFGGGGSSTTAAAPVQYAMPRPIQIEAANSRGSAGLQSSDYGQSGAPRAYDQTTAAVVGGSGQAGAPSAAMAAPTAQTGSAGAQIVVNVQAMDSRSFLDHSQDIAQAVREAMLNMHALNDVVSEL